MPPEVIVCDGKDPPWLHEKIKSLINDKFRSYNACLENTSNSPLCEKLSFLQQS